MDVQLKCPSCAGQVVLRARLRTLGQLRGRCSSCGTGYRLARGQLMSTDPERAQAFGFSRDSSTDES